MKTTMDLLPLASTAFNAGQTGKFFILREASQSIILKGDKMRPVELERGDVVDVSQFDELEITNHHPTSVHVEYQVADVEVRIRTASTAINGALDINEVHTPITINRIQEPLDVQVGNFPTLQKVEITNHQHESVPRLNMLPQIVIDGPQTIAANLQRKGLIVIALESNTDTVMVADFIPIKPGGSATLPASNSLTITGRDNDILNVGEVV